MVYKENTTWLGMRGRDAARKLTLKVDILQVFTIDFSEIQFIVNHNSQSDGQNRSAKSGMNLRKKHTNSLQRNGDDTKDNGISPWTKQAKMGLWSFDLITEPLSWWKIAYTTNQENQLKSPSIQVNKDACDKDKKFSPKITCPALELTNIQDGNTGLHLQVPRGGTHPSGVGSELTIFFCSNLFFCCSWFCFQLIAIHCNRQGGEQNTLTPRIFSHICTYFILVHMHRMTQGVAARVSLKHVHPHVIMCLTVRCLSSRWPLPLSRVPLHLLWFFISSILVIILHVVEIAEYEPPAHTQNEECCPVAIHNPLTHHISSRMERKIECKTDDRNPLVVPGVQATEHQTQVLDDRKQTQAVGDHERWVETELLE